MDKVHVYKDHKGEVRWKRVAPNGKIVSDSGEGYKDAGFCIEQAVNLNPDTELKFDFKVKAAD